MSAPNARVAKAIDSRPWSRSRHKRHHLSPPSSSQISAHGQLHRLDMHHAVSMLPTLCASASHSASLSGSSAGPAGTQTPVSLLCTPASRASILGPGGRICSPSHLQSPKMHPLEASSWGARQCHAIPPCSLAESRRRQLYTYL